MLLLMKLKTTAIIALVTLTACASVHAGVRFGNPPFHGISTQDLLESIRVPGGMPSFPIVVRTQEDEDRAPYWAWLIDAASGRLYRQSPADFSKANHDRPVMVTNQADYDRIPLGVWIEDFHGWIQEKQAVPWNP